MKSIDVIRQKAKEAEPGTPEYAFWNMMRYEHGGLRFPMLLDWVIGKATPEQLEEIKDITLENCNTRDPFLLKLEVKKLAHAYASLRRDEVIDVSHAIEAYRVYNNKDFTYD